MDLLDINVLIYAHREDAPDHSRYADWLRTLVRSGEPFALSLSVLTGFLRLVTNGRIFKPPTPVAEALRFCEQLKNQPNCSILIPTESHWRRLTQLIQAMEIQGAMISDAHLAALALEHDCGLVSADRDFAHFPGLRWQHPLSEK